MSSELARISPSSVVTHMSPCSASSRSDHGAPGKYQLANRTDFAFLPRAGVTLLEVATSTSHPRVQAGSGCPSACRRRHLNKAATRNSPPEQGKENILNRLTKAVANCNNIDYTAIHRITKKMIKTHKSKGLYRFFSTGNYRSIPARSAGRIERILDRLDACKVALDMDLPGFDFHPFKGDRAGQYSVIATGNWHLTFRFDGEDATDVNLEDYD